MPKLSEDGKKTKRDYREKYFIKDVENVTGIKAFTLRMWEQRYGLLQPKRTDTNIRYYEEEDVRLLMNVSILNSHGYKISQIARMSREEIQRMTLSISETSSRYDSQVQALTGAMLQFDEREFNKTLSINILKLGLEETIARIVFPFMSHVGILWVSGTIHVAHEHFITNLIRQRLYVAIDQLPHPPNSGNKRYLLFVPSGENHDISLLFAWYILRSRGQRVIYLGVSIPLEDLQKIMQLHKPDEIFTAFTVNNPAIPVQVYIQTLHRNFPETPVLLTGSQVLRNKELRLPPGFQVVASPDDLIQTITRPDIYIG
ncbi:MAG: MerR family transcriptional regulator [Bacteroidetes bacterium]|nr:MerR family transcriptional regulator [Bacteroidota bacterium]